MLEEPVNNVFRKDSRNYTGKSDYDFSNADKEVNFEILMTIIIIFSRNIKSLAL